MKTIIAIKGNEDNGKSSSIVRIYNDFTSKEIKETEIKDIFEYKGVKIGISSVGDPYSNQGKYLKELVEQECDIIICACRIKGETVRNIIEISNNSNYDLIWTSNYNYAGEKENNKKLIEDLNAQFSEAIIALIEKVLI